MKLWFNYDTRGEWEKGQGGGSGTGKDDSY